MPLYKGVARRVELYPTQYNDINIPGTALGLGASPPDSIAAFGSGNIRIYGFDGNAITEDLHGSGEILHGWEIGTDILVHVHWVPTTTNVGNVKWQLEYIWVNEGEAPSGTTIITKTTAAGGVAWADNTTAFPAISGTGKLVESSFAFRLFRDPTDGEDTYPDDAGFIQIGIHYKVDTLGSTTTVIK